MLLITRDSGSGLELRHLGTSFQVRIKVSGSQFPPNPGPPNPGGPNPGPASPCMEETEGGF